MSTTKKHQDFISEPMRGKLVTDIPGVGTKTGIKLAEQGYSRAENVYGEYLKSGNNQQFNSWLRGTSNANKKNAADCTSALDYHKRNYL